MRTPFSILCILILVACKTASPEERYDVGYSDGYAAGYNTECKIRVTLIEGDWDNKDYSRGYQDGNYAGIQDCRRGVKH